MGRTWREWMFGTPRASWEAGRRSRETANWNPVNQSGDQEIRDSFELLAARGRWLAQNNSWCAAAKRVFLDNILGTGTVTRACAKNDDGTLMSDWNKQADALYSRWLDYCHPFQEMSYGEMTRMNLGGVIESGDSFLLEVGSDDPNSPVPIAFIPFERDQLDTTRDGTVLEGGGWIRNGIQRSDEGKVEGYWLYTTHPRDFTLGIRGSFESQFYPAERVLHLYRRMRPSQTIGLSWFATIAKVVFDTGEYMTAEIAASKLASMFVGMEKRTDGNFFGFNKGTEQATRDDYSNPLALIARGIWLRGKPEDEVQLINSNRPNSNATPWLEFCVNMIGAGVGLSYIRLTGDFSKTNFSSSRSADLQDRKVFKPLQDWHAWNIDLEIRRRVTRRAIALGKLPIPAGGITRFLRNQDRFLAAKALPPGSGYVDPMKQVEAAKSAIAAGLSTWSIELGYLGLEFEDVIEQLAAEQQLIESRGVMIDLGSRVVFNEPEEPEGIGTGPEGDQTE